MHLFFVGPLDDFERRCVQMVKTLKFVVQLARTLNLDQSGTNS